MPQHFGRFWLHEKIGHGGMAEIFRASVGPDPKRFAVEVAVKRLHPHLVHDKAQVDMFLTEADVTKFLRHPNLIHVYEAGFVGEIPYIAMDYVWGIDLSRMMDLLRARRARFPADLAVYVTMQVLRGLDYIHRARAPGNEPLDMVHRDISPPNLFVTFDGEVKIGDFGVARVGFLETREEQTFVKGKPAYIPPEVLGGAPVTARDDLWGLSVCLWEMLSGQRIEALVDEDALRAGRAPRIPPIGRFNPDVDRQLGHMLDQALHPRASRRPPDAYTYYRWLKAYLSGQGIQVGREALARFVRGATGASGEMPKIQGVAAEFAEGGYHAPVGPSMTQRMLVVQARRRWLWPGVIAAGLSVAALLAWLLTR